MTVTATEVSAEKTLSTAAEVEGAILAGYKAIVGHTPPQIALTLLAAQSALETAAWQAMYNWNVGNITHGGDNFDWTIFPGNPLHFRAYTSLDQGAADFVNFLNKRGVIDFADSGDIQGYVNRLQQINYAGSDCGQCNNCHLCTDYSKYLGGMQRYASEYANVVPATPSPGKFNLQSIAIALALAGVTFFATKRTA